MPAFALLWCHRHHMFVNLLALPSFSHPRLVLLRRWWQYTFALQNIKLATILNIIIQDRRSPSFLPHSVLMRCTVLSVSIVSFFTTHAQMQTINGLSPWTVSLIDVNSDVCLFVVDSIEQIAKIDTLP